jgi:hypothetical protein
MRRRAADCAGGVGSLSETAQCKGRGEEDCRNSRKESEEDRIKEGNSQEKALTATHCKTDTPTRATTQFKWRIWIERRKGLHSVHK